MKDRLGELENALARKLADFVAGRQGIEQGSEKHQEQVFAAKVLLSGILKNIVLFTIAAALGILPYVMAMGIGVWRLRKYSFGLHMNSALACMVEGLVVYIGGGLFALHWRIHMLDFVLLYIFILLCLVHYAPAQTKKRPIAEGNRAILKELSKNTACLWTCVGGMVYIVSLFMFPTAFGIRLDALGFALVLGLTVQSLHLLPFMYKIFERDKPPME